MHTEYITVEPASLSATVDTPSWLIVWTGLYSNNVLHFACIQVCNEVQAFILYCRLYVVIFLLVLDKITSTFMMHDAFVQSILHSLLYINKNIVV